MAQELNVRVKQLEHLREQLHKLDAQALGEADFVDTYFKQPKGKVLKLSEKDSGSSVLALQAHDGTFEIMREQPVGNVAEVKASLDTAYATKRVLRGHREYFILNNYKITLHQVLGVGDFISITGEDPQKSFVEKTLGITNPSYVTVSFENLQSK